MMLNRTSGRNGYSTNLFSGRSVHNNCSCDGCGVDPIVNIRYKCSYCLDFDFCSRCMDRYDNELLETHFSKLDCKVEKKQPFDLSEKLSLTVHKQTNHLFYRIAVPLSADGPKVSIPGCVVASRSDWVHSGVDCNYCSKEIVGYRYFCANCAVSICEDCDRKSAHPVGHNLLRMVPEGVVEGLKHSSESV